MLLFKLISAIGLFQLATSVVIQNPSFDDSNDTRLELKYLPIQHSNIYQRREDLVVREDFGSVETQLKIYLQDLIYFITSIAFRSTEFQDASSELAARLSDLIGSVKGMENLNERLLKQLSYVERVFKEMSAVSDYTELFPTSEGKDYRILSCMFQLSISLLSFRNDDGIPYLQSRSDVKSLAAYKRMFAEWKAAFGVRGEVCPPLKIMFARVTKQIEDSFEEFEAYVPEYFWDLWQGHDMAIV